jgi:hypothetical protein
MKGILIIGIRDWLNPKAGMPEEYTHRVFAPHAQAGGYVAWVAPNTPLLAGWNRRPRMEVADDIQIARLGHPLFYRMMAGMFLQRIACKGQLTDRLSVIVNCVTAKPLLVGDSCNLPVVPLVFSLDRRAHVSDDPPGPYIAATATARDQLLRAGAAEKTVLYAPSSSDGSNGITWDEVSRLVWAAIENAAG